MNDDTVKLIGSIQPRQKKNHRKTATSVLAIKDRQV